MRIAERILLSSIKTLTFFADEDTFARRTDAIPQLTCVGQGCKLYQPEAVLCTNIGGRGTEVNWKVCEEDRIAFVSGPVILYLLLIVSVAALLSV